MYLLDHALFEKYPSMVGIPSRISIRESKMDTGHLAITNQPMVHLAITNHESTYGTNIFYINLWYKQIKNKKQ